jgi:AraC family transcriptional regulator
VQPLILTRKAFTVVGLKYRGKNRQGEVRGLWRRFASRAAEIKHQISGGSYGVMGRYEQPFGGMGNYDPSYGDFDYLAGLEVDSAADMPASMESWEIPERTYAVFVFPFRDIREAYRYIYKEWLPASEHQHAETPEFEFYPATFEPDDESSEMFLYVPIKDGARLSRQRLDCRRTPPCVLTRTGMPAKCEQKVLTDLALYAKIASVEGRRSLTCLQAPGLFEPRPFICSQVGCTSPFYVTF